MADKNTQEKNMHRLKTLVTAPLAVAAVFAAASAFAENPPPRNPYLADSFWPIIHGGSDGSKISPQPGPTVKSHALRADEIKWKATGPMESLDTSYSSVYPDGRRVMWVGTHQQLIKLDADTLETLSTYVMHEGTFIGPDDIERIDRKGQVRWDRVGIVAAICMAAGAIGTIIVTVFH